MFKSLTLALLATFAFAAEEAKATKSPATILYEKAIADNSKECDKAYEAYQKSLEAANKKIVKALEAAKKDLNDPSKGKMSISDRADAIKEIDGRIEELKKNALSEVIVAKATKSDDLLGDTKAEVPPAKQEVVKMLTTGAWKFTGANNGGNNDTYTFTEKGTWTTLQGSKWLAGTWRYVKGRTVELTSTAESKQVIIFEVKDGAKLERNGGDVTGTMAHVESPIK